MTNNELIALYNKRDTLTAVIDTVLRQATKLGASAAEAAVSAGGGLSANVRNGQVDKLEYEHDKALSVTVYLDGRKGSASTADFSQQAITESVKAAYSIAQYTSYDKHAGLVAAELMATAIPDLDLYHPWSILPAAAIDLACECEQLAFDYDRRIANADDTTVSTYAGISLYGNTHNFIDGWHWSNHNISCAVIAKASDEMQREGWYSKCCDFNDLQAITEISKQAASRALARLGARKITTCKVPVIFEAAVAAGLFAAFVSAISGGSLYRRASFLLDKKGEQVFADHVVIREKPHLLKALGSAPFDDDGVATQPCRDIVIDGVLQDYVLSGYAARKLGLQTTANAGGIHNLIIEPGQYELAQMIKHMGTGLLITDLIGFGVNQVTGDYSRGASGFWIEAGELAYPVEEITVSGNLAEMYQHIIALGNDIDYRNNILTGSVMIESMTIAGN